MKLSVFCLFGFKRLFTPQKLGVLGDFTPKIGFLGDFTPKMAKPPKGTPLHKSVSFEPSSVKIHRWIWPVGEFPEKGIINKFHYILPRSFHGRICTKFGTAIWAANVITCNRFFGDRSRRVDSVGGWLDSVGGWECHLPLIRPFAINTGLTLPHSPWSRKRDHC